jgi:hypothetical protein
MAGPREVPELEVQERRPSTLRNVDGRPPGGAGVGGPGEPIMNPKKDRWWPPWGCCRYFRQRPPPKLKTSMAAPLMAAGLSVGTTEVEDVDVGPLGVLSVCPAATTTEV